MNSSNESEKEEEANICLMAKHEDREGNSQTSYFTYHELFHICKKIDSETKMTFRVLVTFGMLI